MSFTQPQGSRAPATLDITYSRNEGAPELALLGSDPHLQPDTAEVAEIPRAASSMVTGANVRRRRTAEAARDLKAHETEDPQAPETERDTALV
jgi:hypothetical protein